MPTHLVQPPRGPLLLVGVGLLLGPGRQFASPTSVGSRGAGAHVLLLAFVPVLAEYFWRPHAPVLGFIAL